MTDASSRTRPLPGSFGVVLTTPSTAPAAVAFEQRPMPAYVPTGRALTDVKLMILDTETTGPDPDVAAVIELAVSGWSLNKKRRFPAVFESKINPGVKIPPSSMAVHHIRDDQVVDSPRLHEVMEEVMALVQDHPLVAYNAEFDRRALRGTPLHERHWLDVYRLAMRTWSIGEKNADGFALESFKQQELRYWLGLRDAPGEAHRAAADIYVTGLIFQRCVDRYLDAGMPDDLDRFVAWLESPMLHKTVPTGGRGIAGKTPEELEDWHFKKLFDPNGPMYESLVRFNVLDFLRPEYMRRQAMEKGSPRRGPRP